MKFNYNIAFNDIYIFLFYWLIFLLFGFKVIMFIHIFYQSSLRELAKNLMTSTTLYVGNLSFYTREEQIWELFSRAGEIRRVIMGLHRFDKTPCGFCFVEYVTRDGAEMAMRYVNRTRLDDRVIRTDWDAGFEEGRQYGRGKSGGQVSVLIFLKF